MREGGEISWQRPAQLGIAVVALAVVPGLLAGNPLAGLGPVIVLAFFYCLWRAPLRWPVLALFLIALVADNPHERPAEGQWQTPFYQPGLLLYENLNNITGIKPLRFSLLDVILILLVGVILVRRLARREPAPADEDDGAFEASGLNVLLATAFLTILGLEVLGIARGGDFKASLWQTRELLWLPVVTWIFATTLRGPRDQTMLGLLVMLAATLKTAEGLYYYEVICRPLGVKPAYVTTHSDSLIFVTAVVIGVVGWLLDKAHRRYFVPIVAIAGLGLVLNNRRLAIVSLVSNLALIYLMLPGSRLKRSMTRLALLSLPIVALYAAAGWNSNSAIFGPVKMLSSVLSKDDRSSETRDIENYNLMQTLKVKPLLGWGFGHEYLEVSKADDISQFFALYRYIGHNSVLWLWSVGGLIGFGFFWSLIVFSIYLSARAFRFAVRPLDRTAGMVALSVGVSFVIQAYGDMGLQSWTGVFLLAAALASTSQLAVAVGAWPPAPRPVRVVRSFGWAVPRADARETT